MMRLVPDSIIGRTVMVLLTGLVISHVIALVVYSGDRYSVLATALGQQAAERIILIGDQMEQAHPQRRPGLAASYHRPGLQVNWSPDTPLVENDVGGWRAALARSSLLGSIEGALENNIRVAVVDIQDNTQAFGMGRNWGRGMGRGHMGAGMHHWMGEGRFDQALQVSLQLTDGSWLNFATPFRQANELWTSRYFLFIVLMMVVFMVLSVWAVRWSTQPLEFFARAAERLGVDVNAPPLPEGGPREVRRASHAFNEMQDHLRTFIRDRTYMLAAISHDLRTPITRLKLRAEFVDDEEQRIKMLADLDEMEAMISATLSFAREDNVKEAGKSLDLGALLQSLCDDLAEDGNPVIFQGSGHVICDGRPLALKRAFSNLIVNAVKYGGAATVTQRADSRLITVTVDDDGPGIPESELERVFAPFHRLEDSRSRDTGGAGLGLASARSLIRAHGGEVVMTNRPEGGLRVTVTLPK